MKFKIPADPWDFFDVYYSFFGKSVLGTMASCILTFLTILLCSVFFMVCFFSFPVWIIPFTIYKGVSR